MLVNLINRQHLPVRVDSNDPRYSALSEEKIVPDKDKSEEEDREESVDEPAVPTYREAFNSFSTCISA